MKHTKILFFLLICAFFVEARLPAIMIEFPGGGGSKYYIEPAWNVSDLDSFNGIEFSVLPLNEDAPVYYIVYAGSTLLGAIRADGTNFNDYGIGVGELTVNVVNASGKTVSLAPTEMVLHDKESGDFTVFFPQERAVANGQIITYYVNAGGGTHYSKLRENIARELFSENVCEYGEKVSYYKWIEPEQRTLGFNEITDIEQTPGGTVLFIDQGTALVECSAYLEGCQVVFGEQGVSGSGQEHLNNATGIGVERKTGAVFVADQGNQRIVKLNKDYGFEGELAGVSAWDVASDSYGKVVYSSQDFVAKLDWETKAEQDRWIASGTIKGVSVNREGEVFFANASGNSVVKLDNAMAYSLGQFSGEESNGEVLEPVSVSWDTQSRVFFVESKEGKASELSVDMLGERNWIKGIELSSPQGLSASQRNVLISDTGNQRIILVEKEEKCCGALAVEYAKSRECLEAVCESSLLDLACCLSESDCVYRNKCYAEHSYLNEEQTVVCVDGKWSGLDQDQDTCELHDFEFLVKGFNNWFGENGETCCGNNEEEFVLYPKYYIQGDDVPCNQPGDCETEGLPGEMGFAVDFDGKVCCQNETDCVFGENCYGGSTWNKSVADVDGIASKHLAYCSAGGWFDCDKPNLCEECDAVVDFPNCEGSECYLQSGEDHAFGEFEVEGMGCCGDDTGESFGFFDIGLGTGNPCNKEGGCIGIDREDSACCNTADDCVMGGNCYDQGTSIDLDPEPYGKAVCLKGKWLDCDSSEASCGLCDYLNDLPDCSGSECFVQSGESTVFGEFEANGFGCCGDDESEYLKCNGEECGCCANADDVFEFGKCLPAGAEERDQLYLQYCLEEENQDICAAISNTELKNNGFYSLALQLSNQGICDLIEGNASLTDYCKGMVQSLENDSLPYCGNEKVEEFVGEQCEEGVDETNGNQCPGICKSDCTCPNVEPFYPKKELRETEYWNNPELCKGSYGGYHRCEIVEVNQDETFLIKPGAYNFYSHDDIFDQTTVSGCGYNAWASCDWKNFEYFREGLNLEYWPGLSEPVYCLNTLDEYEWVFGGYRLRKTPLNINKGTDYRFRSFVISELSCEEKYYRFFPAGFNEINYYCFNWDDCPGLYCDYWTGKCTSDYLNTNCPQTWNELPSIIRCAAEEQTCTPVELGEIKCGSEFGYGTPEFSKWYYDADNYYVCNGEKWLFHFWVGCEETMSQSEKSDKSMELISMESIGESNENVDTIEEKIEKIEAVKECTESQ